MSDPLSGMTQAKWDSLTLSDRERIRDNSDLSPQLANLRGWRVEVVRMNGTKARFIVGRSTGWRPCHLEIYNSRSRGGGPADKEYRSVRPLQKVR